MEGLNVGDVFFFSSYIEMIKKSKIIVHREDRSREVEVKQ